MVCTVKCVSGRSRYCRTGRNWVTSRLSAGSTWHPGRTPISSQEGFLATEWGAAQYIVRLGLTESSLGMINLSALITVK